MASGFLTDFSAQHSAISGPARDPCLPSPNLPVVRSPTTPHCPRSFDLFSLRSLPRKRLARIPSGTGASWASPFPSRLATVSGRIEFVFLSTNGSSPVALHPASRRRSYFRLSGPDLTPSGDFHPTDSARSQAH
jgi:hypothetical protein